ncbi:MAG: hypothetical protein E7440_05225 [Ruminococcaceae bacterium]|nr:hypothetical protein [Oscillospiraceae bacterium]
MKVNKSAVVFAALLGGSAFVGVVTRDSEIAWLFMVASVPFFCIQLLCCLTRRWWTRILPIVPIAPLTGRALFYLICDGRGDYLAPLVFLLGGLAPAVGAALAWGIWWFFDYRKRG